VQHCARTEVGVHRALTIGGHHDHAAPSGQAMIFRGRKERDASFGEVAGEGSSEVIIGDLANEPRPPAEAGEAVAGVRHRTATGHETLTKVRHEVLRTPVVDEHHRRLREVVLGKKILRNRGYHVDHCIANGDSVKGCSAHGSLTLEPQPKKYLRLHSFTRKRLGLTSRLNRGLHL